MNGIISFIYWQGERKGSWYSIYYWQHHNNFFMQIFSQAWKNHEIHDINIAKMLVFYFYCSVLPSTNMVYVNHYFVGNQGFRVAFFAILIHNFVSFFMLIFLDSFMAYLKNALKLPQPFIP